MKGVEGCKNLLPNANFSSHFDVEQALCIPLNRGPGASPHTFIFKLLNFCDRNLVLRKAQTSGDLRYENSKLVAFPDYSVET